MERRQLAVGLLVKWREVEFFPQLISSQYLKLLNSQELFPGFNYCLMQGSVASSASERSAF